MKDEAAKFLLALQFLTRIPLPRAIGFTPERMAGTPAYYPLVGIIIGGASALIYWLASLALPPLASAILALAGGLLLTGAFHEDGLADTFDGIGGGLSRDKALAIMKDSRVGTYGCAALTIVLLSKASSLTAMPLKFACLALIAAHALSRLSAVLVIVTSRYVRDEGTGKPVASGLSTRALAITLATGLLVIAAWVMVEPPASMLAGLGGLVAGHLLMRLFFERKLGGYTGDTLGAVQQLSETGFYLGLLAWL